MDKIISELKKWVTDNYNSEQCGWTSQRSEGNYDDCFNDGCSSGNSYAAYQVGCILGMKLEKPEEPKYEF